MLLGGIYLGGKARVGVGEGGAAPFPAVQAVLQVAVLRKGAHALRQVLQDALVILHPVILDDDGTQHGQLPVANGVLAALV